MNHNSRRNRRLGIILSTLGLVNLLGGLSVIFIALSNPTSTASGWESMLSLATLAIGAILLTFGSMGISVTLFESQKSPLKLPEHR